MDDKPYSDMNYGQEGVISAHLSGARHRPQSTGYTSLPPAHAPTMFHGSQYHLPYTESTGYGLENFPHPANSIGSHKPYPESSQRTILHENISEHGGFSSLPTSFDAPQLRNVASNDFSTFNTPHVAMNDRPPSNPLSINLSRSSPPQGHSLLHRRRSEAQFSSALSQGPGAYYSPSMGDYSIQRSASAGPAAGISQDHVAQMLASMAHAPSRGTENNHHPQSSGMPTGSTLPFHSMGPNDPLVVPSMEQRHRHNLNRSLPPSATTSSIPMRKASADWMSQSVLSDTDRHSSMAARAPDVRPDNLTSVKSSLVPQKDDKSPRDRPSSRTASPNVPVSEQGPSKASTPVPKDGTSTGEPPKKKKKSKMHACEICDKKFPRPSGLRTHMNTHNNARPYPCGYPGCTRTFGVRSNAKRHLRTHGVIPTPAKGDPDSNYVVGFSTPLIGGTPDADSSDLRRGGQDPGISNPQPSQIPKPPFFKLRWMPPSLTSRNNAAALRSVSESGDMSEDDDEEDEPESRLLLRNASRESTSSGVSFMSGLEPPPPPSTSSSNTSQSVSPPECGCPIPCGRTPCISWARANFNQPFPLTSDVGRSSSDPYMSSSKPRGATANYDEPGSYHPSQVHHLHSF